jgi:hypothetical protein
MPRSVRSFAKIFSAVAALAAITAVLFFRIAPAGVARAALPELSLPEMAAPDLGAGVETACSPGVAEQELAATPAPAKKTR